ncbi:FAD-dependent oxidoreductase [Acuticoccus sp. MNP-M23]|uniref:oxidoreductase n=1 Tax=Acuticoccus sp. MNP-M23 TaxID=3072793 RepID=UPI002816725D|nr:FAD-dependent oxidoreductase [Acuticoccus sp. MNP-M23]WMS42568.1 FAD-dependent oxidoreductase [Acuticoccus sp. MNP-M23]
MAIAPIADASANDPSSRFSAALAPIAVGRTVLRNRIFVPAHTTNFGHANLPTDRHAAYHRARAEGGVALIIFEGIRVHQSSLGRAQGVNGYEDAAVPAFARVADAVHEGGAKLFGQIIHLGRHIDGNFTRTAAWSSSPTPWTTTAPPPHPMSEAEIAAVVDGHVRTALNMLEAGLDGIELQMAHGHLLQQFLSPAVNVRTDRYGGSADNRLRFSLETLEAVRAAVGDATLGIRISADEFLPGGLCLEDMTRIVRQLAGAVKVDFVNVSHSAYHGSATISMQMADMAFANDAFRHFAPAIKAALSDLPVPPPVMAVCKFRTMDEAEAAIASGGTDMVGMARAHIAEPALVAKSRAGRDAEIRPCINCNQGCAGFLALNLPITCLTNPATGREMLAAPQLAQGAARRVVVVGAGPGGLEAAATAAERGHDVELWDEAPAVGGALARVAAMPLRADFARLLEYQAAKLDRTGVTLRTGHAATAQALRAAGADAVILATGAAPRALALETGAAMTVEAAMDAGSALGRNVVLEDRLGTWTVVAVAEWLADRGHTVTLLAPTGVPGWTISVYSSFALRQRLKDKGVAIRALATLTGFANGTATITDLSTGASQNLDGVDAVVAPVHGVPRNQLAAELAGADRPGENALPVHVIGDAEAPRTALEAVFEGHQAASML